MKIDLHDVRLFEESYFCSLKISKEANKSSEIKIIAEHIWENYNDLNVTTVGCGPDIDPIFPKELFKKFPNLRHGVLANFSTVEQNWFKNADVLETLTISFSNITRIEGEVFVNLENLIALSLRLNLLTHIDEKAFVGLKKLKHLDLGENSLSNLHPGMFNELTKLENLYLDLNQITELHENLFARLESLKVLNLLMNPITNLQPNLFRNLKNLKSLHMANTPLESIPEGIFKTNLNLEFIDFENSKLSRIPYKSFSHLKKLRDINLRNNICISENIGNQNASIYYTEDALVPCSCTLAKKLDTDFIMGTTLKCLVTGSALTLLIFIVICRRKKTEVILVSSVNEQTGKNGLKKGRLLRLLKNFDS
jgi:hypothetical protein